jgi:large subunit ribosomal protein L17
MTGRFGRTNKERKSLLRSQASELLWYGKIETTITKAKAVKAYTEKIITAAINSYEDTIEFSKKVKDSKGKEVEVKSVKDGVKKLNTRRNLMNKLYDLQEIKGIKESKGEYKARTSDVQHPLLEKLFNEIAPKYAARAEEKKQGGGYARIYQLGARRGDAAEMAILELID